MTAAIRASLSELANGDIDIRGARSAIRSAIKAGGSLVDAAYAAIRDTTFRIVSSRDQQADLALWFDLSKHAAALTRDADRSDLADRIIGFAELIAQTARFADRQPLDELLGRKHVAELLEILGRHPESAPRAALAEETQLANANLSRVLGILSTHGLIRRSRAGKEARIGLTEAGLLAAAKLGYAAVPLPIKIDWWRSLSVPIAVWTADGEPLGVNDSFRDVAATIGTPTPSMLSHQGWSDLVEAAAREVRATDLPGIRDVRLPTDTWLRIVEDRLGDGKRLAMIIDFSAQMRAQEDVERSLANRNEEVAALRAELARVKAKLEETERKLLSFTNWLTQARDALTGETASLATRLRRWRDRLKFPSLRQEAEDADKQIAYLRNAMQTLLYTSRWTGSVHEPLQLADPKSVVANPVSVIKALGVARIDLDESGIVDLPAFKGHVPEIQAVIGQCLYHFVQERQAPTYFVKTDVFEKNLHVLCTSATSIKARPSSRSIDWFLQHADDPFVFHAGFGHARDVAEVIGGTIHVGKDQSYVIMSLPIEPGAKRGRGRKTATVHRFKAIP